MCLLPSGLQGEAAIANQEWEVAAGGSEGEAEGQGGEGGQGEAGQQRLQATLPAVWHHQTQLDPAHRRRHRHRRKWAMAWVVVVVVILLSASVMDVVDMVGFGQMFCKWTKLLL